MKAFELLTTLGEKVQKEKKISPDFDYELIGCALLTLDKWTAADPKDRMFGEAPVNEWEVPLFIRNILQFQKVSIITNNVDIPDCGDRTSYGDPVQYTFKDTKGVSKTVNIEAFTEPEDLKSAFVKLANYYKRGVGPLGKLTELTGDVSLTSVEVVSRVIDESKSVPVTWDGELPITLKSEYNSMFGDEHFLVKMREKKIVDRLVDAIEGNGSSQSHENENK